MNHKEIKKEIQSTRKSDFLELLDDSMLNETEKKFMKMFYIDHKDIEFIADTLGYSRIGILKMHNRCLKRLEPLL